MTNSPQKSTKNVALPPGFSDHLRSLREASNLSKTDLADQASTTYRTIQNLETDRHQRAQEKTLMGIAEALGLSFAELMEFALPDAPQPAPKKRRRAPWILAILGVIFVATAWTTWSAATSRATWDRDLQSITAHDSILGLELWTLNRESNFTFCKPAPWDPGLLLVGTGNVTPDGGRMLGVDRATGKVRWELEPDQEQLISALGRDIVTAATMTCRMIEFLDVDGDGEQEVAVGFIHGLNYPSAICLVNRDGTLAGQYSNKGHLYSMVAADFDADGKDELVASGVNNDRAFGGPTLILLDDLHWRGASVDSLCNPWSQEPDSSVIRVAIPGYPEAYHFWMRDTRLAARNLRAVPQADGRIFLNTVVIGGPEPLAGMWVQFDDRLRVLDSSPHDSFSQIIAQQWPDSLKVGTGPDDAEWRAEWLGKAQYFGADLGAQ